MTTDAPQATGKTSPIIESRDQLIASFARGEKPAERWRIGTEHEKFVYARRDHHAPSYDEPGGIRDLLADLTRHGWRPACAFLAFMYLFSAFFLCLAFG